LRIRLNRSHPDHSVRFSEGMIPNNPDRHFEQTGHGKTDLAAALFLCPGQSPYYLQKSLPKKLILRGGTIGQSLAKFTDAKCQSNQSHAIEKGIRSKDSHVELTEILPITTRVWRRPLVRQESRRFRI
jgi:hypothetical protein